MAALNNTSAAGVTAKAGVTGQGTAVPAAGAEDNINITGADIDDEEFDDEVVDESGEDDGGDDGDDGDEGDDVDDEQPADKGQKAKQTPEQNAVFADIRRKAETEARIKATQEAQRTAAVEVDKAFADMGLTDPYTNKAITTKAEYTTYKAKHNSELIGTELNKAGISREAMDALISSHPAVKKAEEAAASYESAQRQAQDGMAKVQLDEQLKEISALDPAIKTVDDLAAQPNYEQLRGYVRKGLTIVEAFKLVNMDKLSTKTASAAAQSAYNKTQSKEHLTSTATRGQGEAPISKAQMNAYKMLKPNMSDKDIRADYAKFQKKYSK